MTTTERYTPNKRHSVVRSPLRRQVAEAKAEVSVLRERTCYLMASESRLLSQYEEARCRVDELEVEAAEALSMFARAADGLETMLVHVERADARSARLATALEEARREIADKDAVLVAWHREYVVPGLLASEFAGGV